MSILSNSSRSDPELTELIQELFLDCPVLFQSILPRSEHMLVDGPGINDDDDEAFVTEDDYHKLPSVTGCIQAKYCDAHAMPTRGSRMADSFRHVLSQAYGRYYKMLDIVSFPNSTLQWCKKRTFTDP